MSRQIIQTDKAPAAIGPYSQAVRAGDTVYLSGQIPLDPGTGLLVEGDITAQARRSFENLKAVCEAAGGSLGKFSSRSSYPFPPRICPVGPAHPFSRAMVISRRISSLRKPSAIGRITPSMAATS